MARKIDVSLISGNGGSNGQLLGANTGNVSFQSVYTGNVIESGNTTSGNVYFSNARAIGALIAGDNISIAANGRISANLSAVSVSSVTGNLNVTGNVIANGFVSTSASAGVISSSGNITMTAAGAVNINSTNVIATGNVIANNFISTGQGSGLLSSTGNVTISASGIVTLSGSSIVVNGPLTANSYSGIVTANVAESASNLYFTNARVYANVVSLLAAKANVSDLSTSNIAEGNNLYYTNARVASNVIALMPSLQGNNIIIAANGQISANLSGVSVNVNNIVGNLNVSGNVIANGFVSSSASAGLITSSGNITMTAAGAVNINSTNVIASGNIIANTFISAGAGSASLSSTGNVGITGVGNITLNTGNVIASGNIYAAKFYGDGSALTGVAATAFSGNTDGITQGTNNLFYTNTRVYSNTIALLPTLAGTGIAIAANGQISTSGQNTATTANVTFGALNVTGPVNFYGNVTTYSSNNLSVSDNMIYLNSGSESSNPDLGFAGNYNDGTYRHAGFFRDASDGNWKVYDGYTLEPDANIFINTAHASFRLANLQANVLVGEAGVFTGNIQAGNLITGSGTGGSFTGANLISAGNISATSWLNLYTANVVESGSLYYTNARVVSNVIAYLAANPQSGGFGEANIAAYLPLYTGNIQAGNVIANSFVSPTATSATLTSTGNLNITAAGAINLTTPNVLVSGNIIANNFISTGSGSGEVTSTSNLLLSATGNLNLTSSNVFVNGNLVLRGGLTGLTLTTTSITEGSNLYYTNARVYSNVLAMLPTYTGNLTAGNLIVTGGIIDTTGSLSIITGLDSNIELTATGNGRIVLDGQSWPHTDGATGYILQTNGTGNLFWAAPTASSSFSNANVAAYLTTYTGNIQAGNVIANSFVSPTATSATLTSTGNLNITAAGTVNLTSPNVIASGNLIANTFIASGAGSGEVTSTSNLLLSATGNLNLTGGNIYVNSPITFRGTVTGISAGGSVTQANLTTANVTELASSNNLYYTNARVHSNVIAALPTYTGNISAGNLIVTGGIIDNVGTLTIATTSNSNVEITADGTGRIVLDSQIWPHTPGPAGYSLQTNGTGNLFWGAQSVLYSNANVGAYLTTYTGNISAGNVIANTVISPSATSGTLNSTGNLNIIAQNNTINLTSSNVLASGNIIANTFIATGTGSAELSTSSNLLLSATGNLNLTSGNIFINSPVTFRSTVSGITLTTANVAENAASGNLYYTNARVYSNVVAALATYTGNISANNITAGGTGVSSITATGNLVISPTGTIIAQSPFRFPSYANALVLANTSIGDTVYNTAANALVVYTSSGWSTVGSGGSGGSSVSAAKAVGYSLIFGG